MSSYNPVHNIKNYISGSHRFLNIGTGSSSTSTNTLVTLEKKTVMIIQSCNIGIGTTLPRTTLDIVGRVYVSQNIGIGTTIIGANALNVIGNVSSSGSITVTNYFGGSATLSGSLTTSNLTVLGSNTIVNTYTQQSSNFSVCNITGTGPALSISQKGIGAGYPIADFYDVDIFPSIPSLRIADGGNIGIGTSIPVAKLHIQGNVYSTANIGIGTTIFRQALDIIGDVITSGNIGIGTTLPSARLQVDAGTTTVAPLQFTSGTNLTTVAAGTMEYDSINFYGTVDTRSGRGYIPNIQIFRLTADRSAIGPAISNFFGANSSANLIAGGIYELEAHCFFLKTTSATVTFTLTTSQAVVNLDGTIDRTVTSGGTVTGSAGRACLYKSATTANVFPNIGTLTGATSHFAFMRVIIEANLSNNSTLTINVTEGSGTVTPYRGSYYILSRLPGGNSGIFSA